LFVYPIGLALVAPQQSARFMSDTEHRGEHKSSSVGAPTSQQVRSSPLTLWKRAKEHKVLQWTLAYLAAALALAHGQELVAHAFDWPEAIGRITISLLAVGLPIAVALAWYHGHKGLRGVSSGELMMMSILLLIGAGLLVALVHVPRESVGTEVAHAARSASTQTSLAALVSMAPAASVAVVPFANLTGDTSKEYFSDGMAEELIDTLAQVPGLKVPSRTSSFAYKGRNVDIRRIAQDLGVRTILEGSVRGAGERIRVTAQLVDATSGYHIWSQSYDRDLGDIFKLQDDLAGAIVQVLKTKMNVAVAPLPTKSAPTADVQAYQLYLQAQAVSRGSKAGTRQSLSLLDQAIARDPKFARAIAERAVMRAASVALEYAPLSALAEAERDAIEVLQLTPGSAQAYSALGFIYELRGEWSKAEPRFRRALAIDPTDPRAHHLYATLLVSVGQLRLAQAEVSEAFRLAPADIAILSWLANTNSLLGLDAEATEYADLTVAQGGSTRLVLGVYGNAAFRSGRLEELRHMVSAGLPAPARSAADELLRLLIAARAEQGRQQQYLRGARSLGRDMLNADPTTIDAVIYMLTALGDLDGSYQLIDEYLTKPDLNGSHSYLGFLWAPETQPLRMDPRFGALAVRLRFVDYWRQYGPPDACDLQGEKLTCR
jgi:TolB-like protein/tetratricopeptide (TPR) repeat protein